MRLKRHYQVPDGWVKQINARNAETGALLDPKRPEGDCLNPPPLDYVEVHHTGTSPEQKFSDKVVMGGLREGWISITTCVLTLHAKPEDLRYMILRVPGKYQVEGGGYEVIHSYECVLDAEQHAKYCAQTEAERREAFYVLQGFTPRVKAHARKKVACGK